MNNTSPTAFKCFKALLQADLLVLVRNKRALFISMLLPLVILFIFDSGKRQDKIGGATFIVGLAITLGLLSASILGYGLAVARDREKGVFQRLRVSPAPTWTIMASRLSAQVLANLIIAIVVLVVGSSLFHLSLGAFEYISVILVSIIGGALFLSIGQALVGLLKSADTINAGGRILLIGLMLFGIFGLSGIAGPTLQNISEWTPVGSVITVLQSAFNQTAWSGHTSIELATCFGYIIFCSAIGIKWFQWEAR